MAETIPFTKPVEDAVPKVDNTVAVGENLEFQRRWWRFEHVVWCVFTVIVLCDIAGLFGRGFLAKAHRQTADGTLALSYERVQRGSTPSIMTYKFGPGAVHDGRIQLFVSQSLIKTLGAQRISPQPLTSAIDDGGITYTFPAAPSGGNVEISLEPSFPGIHDFTTGISGAQPIQAKVVVLP